MILKRFRLPVLLLILVSVLTFSSCSDKEDETFIPDESMLIDTDWLLTGVEGTSEGKTIDNDYRSSLLDDKSVMRFDKDKAYNEINNKGLDKGTWTLVSEKLTITEDDDKYTLTIINLTSDTLVMSIEPPYTKDGVTKEDKVTFTFTKQKPFVADESLLVDVTWKMTGVSGIMSGEPITGIIESILLSTNETIACNSNGELVYTTYGESMTLSWSLDGNKLDILGDTYTLLRLNETTAIMYYESEYDFDGSTIKTELIEIYTKQ